MHDPFSPFGGHSRGQRYLLPSPRYRSVEIVVTPNYRSMLLILTITLPIFVLILAGYLSASRGVIDQSSRLGRA